jgi:hypothetical protein
MMMAVNHVPIPFRFHERPFVGAPTGHGIWDISLFVLAAIAAAGALLAVWLWILQLRRTPEVRFDWWIDGTDEWHPHRSVQIELGKPLRLHLVISNVGTGAADGAIINVLAPSFMHILAMDSRTGEDLPNYAATDNVVHDPPDNHVTWVASRVREFYPSLPVIISLGFAVENTGHIHQERDHVYYLAVSFEAVGLPASGTRLLPSWAHRVPGEKSWPNWGKDDFWGQEDFPGEKYRRSFRRVKALPKNHVRAGPGKRQDRRPITVDFPLTQPTQS